MSGEGEGEGEGEGLRELGLCISLRPAAAGECGREGGRGPAACEERERSRAGKCGRSGGQVPARGAPTRMMAALVLPPKPRPSQKPAPSATTFLSAPPGVWNAAESATSAEVHGRNAASLGASIGP